MQRERLSIPKIVLYILVALTVYVLQTTLFGAWSIRGYHLDMLPALVAGAMSRLTLSGSYISMLIMTALEMVVLGLVRYFAYLLPQAGASFALVLQQIVGGTLLSCVFCFVVYLPMRKISRIFADR